MTKRKQYVIVRKKNKVVRQKSFLKGFLWFILVALCLGVGYIAFDLSHAFLFVSPYFSVKKVDITGTSPEEAQKIYIRLGVAEGDNIFSFRIRQVIEKLKKAHPEIKEVRFKRKLPGRVHVHVVYRDPIARIKFGERMLCVDEDGIIFLLPKLDQQVYLKRMFLPELMTSGDIERKTLVRFLKYLRGMEDHFEQDIVKLYTEIPLDIVFYLSDGTKIAWGVLDDDQFEQKFNRMMMVYRDALKRFKGIRYINVRYWQDGRVLVRPRGSSGTEVEF